MNDQMNAPMSPMQSSPTSFFQTWINALTKPNERTFADMAASPDASAGKAYVWVFLAALVSFFISVVVQVLSTSLGVGQQSEEIRRVMGSSVIGLICAVPFVAGFSVLGFMISTAIVQWVAGLFKGAGTFNQLAYVFGAISAPATLISSVLSIFYAIPFLAFCLWPLSALLGIYVLVLEVMAIKGVNKFGWGEAIGSLFLPGLVILCCLSVAVFGLMSLLAPNIGDIFSTINQSLVP